MTSLLFVFVVCATGAGEVDREQLIRLLESSRPEVSDFAFEFEGDLVLPREQERKSQGVGPDGIKQTFSGTYAWRRDGATLAEVFSFNKTKNLAEQFKYVTLDGVTHASVKSSTRPEAVLTKKKAGPEDYLSPGSYGRIFLKGVVLGFARSRLLFESESVEKIDDRRCVVVRFSYTEDPAAARDKLVSEIFWIDPGRDAHVLRYEQRWGANLVKVVQGIRLGQFTGPSGNKFWLPIAGQREGHVSIDLKTKDTIYSKEAIYIEKYDLLPVTMRIGRGLDDKVFSVEAKPGDIVDDHLQGSRYEFGQYLARSGEHKERQPTDTEIKQGLDTMLRDSDVLARELKATSVSRRGPSWTERLPWIVCGLALSGLLVLVGFRARAYYQRA